MRATQFIEYINRQEHPTADEGATLYTHLTFTTELKAARRKYRALNAHPTLDPCSSPHEEEYAKVTLLKHPVGI